MQYRSILKHKTLCYQLKKNIGQIHKAYSTGLFSAPVNNITHKVSGQYKYPDLPSFQSSLHSDHIRLYSMTHTPRVLTGKLLYN
jgi:hypothetical protein